MENARRRPSLEEEVTKLKRQAYGESVFLAKLLALKAIDQGDLQYVRKEEWGDIESINYIMFRVMISEKALPEEKRQEILAESYRGFDDGVAKVYRIAAEISKNREEGEED
jgi:hypothetical protein